MTNGATAIADPTGFPHFATATVTNKLTFNSLDMYRCNNTASFLDEIRVGLSYEANNGRAGSTNAAPGIVTPPQTVWVNLGDPAAFSVTAAGSGPLHYQWRKNGADIAGQSGSVYDLERSPNLTVWTPLVTNLVAPANGLMPCLEMPPTDAAAFYRLKLH